VVASLFEIVPTFLIRSNVPTIATVTPYTPLELAGRDVYIQEGCNNCHSQMVRPLRAETVRYGEYSKAGEFVYDHPFLWGSRRIGPDLHRVGNKYPNLWHIRHFEDPTTIAPGSLMPKYIHLFRSNTDFDGLAAKLRAQIAVGVPYSEADVASASETARTQAQQIATEVAQQGGPQGLEDKQVTALIAYLQRLGTDIRKAPPAAQAANSSQGAH
jgi:cytochrome c oxidase cbb3-type subunit I/II